MNLIKRFGGELHSTKTITDAKKQYHVENKIKIDLQYRKEKKMLTELVGRANIFFSLYSF